MSYKSVRDALLYSVACTRPPVNLWMSQLSIVPNANSPFAALSRAPATSSSSHFTLVPEK
jgi:hypothetical protein